MMIIVNRSLVLCADVYSTLNKHWNDTNRMIIMNLIARQDIIGKLGTVILFLKKLDITTNYFVIVKWSLSVPSLFS